MAQCQICLRHNSRNKNVQGFRNEWGERMVLCTTHNAAAEEVAEDGPINWLAMSAAAASISADVYQHPERRDDLVQLEPLVKRYRKYAKDPDVIRVWRKVQRLGKKEQEAKQREAQEQARKKRAAARRKAARG